MTYQPPNVPEQPNQSAGQPPFGPYYGPPPAGVPVGDAAQPGGRKNSVLWIIIGGVVALLVLCCGGGAATLYAFRGELAAADAAASSPSPFPDEDPLAPPFVPSPAPSPTPSALPENLKPGATLVVTSEEGDELQVTIKSPRTRKSCSEYSKPKSGGYLIVDVTMHVTKGTGRVSPYDFTFLSPDSTTTDNAGGEVTDCGKDLDHATNVRPGTKRSGQLVFDVKPAKGQIIFKRSSEIAGSWKIG